jgi:8-amino-7-oxononanoate synthase
MSQLLNGTSHTRRNMLNVVAKSQSKKQEANTPPDHVPFFEKCDNFTTANEMRDLGLYPYFRTIESAQDTEVRINGKKMLMLGSNSYMGLTNDPRIKEAGQKALATYGSGCAGSRFLNGTLDIHIELEEQLAAFHGKEAALVFTTGYQANVGTISALVGREDNVFIDRMDHASIVDGARLCYGRKIFKFNHNEINDLERKLAQSTAKGKLVIVDGIYSMEGDIAKLPEIVEVAKKHRAAILVDDAHSVGVLGKSGNGTADHFNLTNEVDLIVGTFSKSLASIGGYTCGDKSVIDYLKHHSRALIFSASMSPPNVAAAQKALEIVVNEPERRDLLWRNTMFMHKGLRDMGLDIGETETPIMPVVVGETERCFALWRSLHDAGIFINPVVTPAVPPNRALIRLSVMATHTLDQLTYALETIEKHAKAIGIIENVI